MAKKLIFLLLIIQIKLYSNEDNPHRIYFTQHVLSLIPKNDHQHTEQSITAEFKDILKNGVMPKSSITQWIEDRVEVLLSSPRLPVKNAGLLLRKVSNGDIISINGFEAVPTIVQAVQEHHEDFSLSWFERGKAVIYGTQWFFSGK